MSKDTSTPPTPEPEGDGDSPGGAPDGTQDKENDVAYWKQQAKENQERRDSFAKKLRLLEKEKETLLKEREDLSGRATTSETRLQELEQERNRLQEEADIKAGNFDKVQNAWNSQKADLEKKLADERAARVKEVEEWKAKYDGASKKFYDNFVRRTLLEELSKCSENEQSALLHLSNDFKFVAVEDDDGNFVGVKAEGSDKSIEELHDEICEKYKLPFQKNKRKPGAGTQPPGDAKGANGPAAKPADFDKWPKEKQRKWFADNPGYRMSWGGGT